MGCFVLNSLECQRRSGKKWKRLGPAEIKKNDVISVMSLGLAESS